MAPHTIEVNGSPLPRAIDSVQSIDSTNNPFRSGETSVSSTNSPEMSKASSPQSQTFPEEDGPVRPRRRSGLGRRTPTQEDKNERRVRSSSPRDSSRRGAKERAPSIEPTVERRDFESVPREALNRVGPDIEECSEDSAYESAWDRQAALSFDGGGIRGYASLLMLQRLMNEVITIEQTHPNGPHSSSFDFDTPKVKPTTRSRQKHPNLKGTASTAIVDAGPSSNGNNEGERKADTNKSITQLEGGESNQLRQETEDDAQEREKGKVPKNAFLPCHYWDFIAGTSTGGLIAIMLGRFRMPVDECLRQYEVFGKQIFGSPRKFSVKGVPRDKYSSKPVVNALQTLTMTKTPKNNERDSANEPARMLERRLTGNRRRPDTFVSTKSMIKLENSKKMKEHRTSKVGQQQSVFSTFRSPEDLCKVIAVATKIQEKHKSYPYVFRSYEPRFPDGINFRGDWLTLYNPKENNAQEQIWEVGRATSAAPTFFKAMKIGEAEYIDGAFESNNPSYELWKEITARSRRRTADTFQVFVSFGTGKPARDPGLAVSRSSKLVRPIKKLWKIGQYSIGRLTEAEQTHTQMKGRFRDHNMQDKYHRFNVDDPVLGTIELDEWIEGKKGKDDTLVFIRKAVAEEFENEDVKKDLRKCAKLLVDHRRDRACASSRKAASRWERFSKCTTFRCPYCAGHDWISRFDFCSHLTEQHQSEWQKPSEQDEEGIRSFNERLDRHIWGPRFRDGDTFVGPW